MGGGVVSKGSLFYLNSTIPRAGVRGIVSFLLQGCSKKGMGRAGGGVFRGNLLYLM